MAAPLILTVALPPALQAAADAQRRALDPARAARTPAHLTLFRHLPGLALAALLADCRALADTRPGFTVRAPEQVDGAVQARVAGPTLDDLRAELAARWRGLLLPGDLAPPRLHISLAGRLAARNSSLAGRRAARNPLPPPLPAGPHRAAGLLLWRHAGAAPPRGEAFWSPLVAVAFRR